MFTATPPIEPITLVNHLRLLDDKQLVQFQSGTFEILEKTDFHCPSQRALKIYADHGAKAVELNRILQTAEKELSDI